MNFSTNFCWVTGLSQEEYRHLHDPCGCGDPFEEGYQNVIDDLDKQ